MAKSDSKPKRRTAQVAGKRTGTATLDPSEPDRHQPAEPSPKRRGGAPRGNTNRSKDPAFTKAMRAAKVAARRGRRKRQRDHQAAAEAVIAEVGLADSPLAQRTAKRLAEVDAEIGELGRIVDRVGRVKRDGSLSPTYEKQLVLIGQDRAELRHLIDRLAEVAATRPRDRDVRYVVQIVGADGSVVHESDSDGNTWVDADWKAEAEATNARQSGQGIIGDHPEDGPEAAPSARRRATPPPDKGTPSPEHETPYEAVEGGPTHDPRFPGSVSPPDWKSRRGRGWE